MKVKHIMRSRVIAVKPQEEVSTALKIMNENRINGTPVVDDNNKLLGIVVKADIYRFLIAPGHYESCPVDWVMTKDVVTAHPEEDLITAARRLREKNVIALPVVDGENYLQGILTIEDIVDYFLDTLDKAKT